MQHVTPIDPFRAAPVAPDPLPHFAPFFMDPELKEKWEFLHMRRAEDGGLFAPPDTGFHHNPMESDVSYLYVAESPNFPGEVKIGMSKNRPDARLQGARWDKAFRLDPDIRISAFVMMKNVRAREVETATHKLLSGLRSGSLMGEKEWFGIEAEAAMCAIELAARNYANPKRVHRISEFVTAWQDPACVAILDNLFPDPIENGSVPLADDTVQDPKSRKVAARRFHDLHGASFQSRSSSGETDRTDLVFIAIVPAPDRYLWDYAKWLIPHRAALFGEDDPDIYPENTSGSLRSLDVSIPEHQPFLKNRIVLGNLSWNGSVKFGGSSEQGVLKNIDKDANLLYETDLVNSPLMARITDLYHELRERLDRSLPAVDDPSSWHDVFARKEYLQKLSAFLVSARPEDITPRTAQCLHSVAMNRAGTPPDMAICPVELCEIVGPILERSGRTVEMSAPSDDPEVG